MCTTRRALKSRQCCRADRGVLARLRLCDTKMAHRDQESATPPTVGWNSSAWSPQLSRIEGGLRPGPHWAHAP